MQISQGAIAALYLYAVLLGLALGALYDLLRITRVFLGVHYSRRLSKRFRSIRFPLISPLSEHKESRALGAVIFIEDFIFCLFSGLALILLFYQSNYGKIRIPALFCAGGGFLLYRITLGRLVMLFSEAIAFAIEILFRYLGYFCFYPIRMAIRFLSKLGRAICQSIKNNWYRRARIRYTANEMFRARSLASSMIPKEDRIPPHPLKGKQIDKRNKRNKKAVQPASVDQDRIGGHRAFFHRHICK